MNATRFLAAALLAAPLLALSGPARAASSYDACAGTITSLPTTITTQGTWCLKKDLNTAITTGNAITIAVNNVAIDCNGFKLGGLLAGPATAAIGVYANGRANVSVRDCNIRGFHGGVFLDGSSGSGHRIERNRFEGNTGVGMSITGDGSMIRDNLVIDTGGSTIEDPAPWVPAILISGRVDVIDNQITGVFGGFVPTIGILVGTANGQTLRGNRISGLVVEESVPVAGIVMFDGGPIDIRENTISNDIPAESVVCAMESGNQWLHANALMMGPPHPDCIDGGKNYGFLEIP